MAHIVKCLLVVLGALAMGQFLISMIPNLLPARRRNGRASEGLVIFVEGIRWLSVPWDLRPAYEGLRRAGFAGRFVYWKWHTCWQAWLALPVLMNRRQMDARANRLAEFITRQRRRRPRRPIYLMGCSCGAYVAIRALELLPADVSVQATAWMAGAFDSRRNVAGALAHVSGPAVVTSSVGDWILLGLGTSLFGTADRRFGISAGFLGLRRPDDWPADMPWPPSQVTHIRWRLGMIRLGHWGGHFTAPAVVARHIAPAMGFAPQDGKTQS